MRVCGSSYFIIDTSIKTINGDKILEIFPFLPYFPFS